MSRENILFGVIGLLAGLIIGFMVTNSLNQKMMASATPVIPGADARTNANIPPGHPDISGGNVPAVGPATPGGMQPQVQADLEKAKQNPTDFDAQMRAAEDYYQVQRFDDAVNYYIAANKLKPDDRDVIVHLANAYFDGDQYENAEKWYATALAKKPDDVDVRTDYGLTFVFRDPPDYDRAIQEFNRSLETNPKHPQTLQNLTVAYTKKGDMEKARATLSRLEAVDPGNEAISKLRSDLDGIGSGKKE